MKPRVFVDGSRESGCSRRCARLVTVLLGALSSVIALAACGPEAAQSSEPALPQPAAIDEDQARVLAALNAERNARELPPVELVADVRPLKTAAEMIRRGSPPDIALRTALERVVENESSEGRGWCVPSENLSELQFPSALVEDDALTVGIVVVRASGRSDQAGAAGADSPAYVVCYLVMEGIEDYHGN